VSYRAFKRLLGETSLERKCRFLLGAAVLLLVTMSFWLYAWQTEQLAFDQMVTSGRLLVDPLVAKMHLEKKQQGVDVRQSMDEFLSVWESHWPKDKEFSNYHYFVLKKDARNPENKPSGDEVALMRKFAEENDKQEEVRMLRDREKVYYYAAIRASKTCLECHNRSELKQEPDDLQEGSLMAVVRFELSTEPIKRGFHTNRAWLICNAIVTVVAIMLFSALVIRYVIVKPVKHLKDVSDAIYAGQLNVRSEIQTGDEFEDLSAAFNRMLRNLVSMQDRLRKLNTDLDLKVDQLARTNLALFESNRIKSDFLATMSHELRTPLNSILGFSDVLLSNPQLPEKLRRWVENIQGSGRQLLALITDILDLAKIEAGKMQLRPEPFSLAEVSDGMLNMFRPVAEKKHIELKQERAADLPVLHQDAGKVRQILSNLLSNALKFTPEGGRVQFRAEAAGDSILLKVIDTGVGIAPEDQERVFEKFRQAANPLTREHDGSGLGLSIVRELSKLLGGGVSLHSELGRGSTFTVRLPIQLPPQAETLPNGAATAEEAPSPVI